MKYILMFPTVVHVLEFHKFVCSSKSEKKEVLKWLNRKLDAPSRDRQVWPKATVS